VYRNCIFCSCHLGNNQAIEYFPAGRTLAFDSMKGRLWVVCPACHRWNLAPIEERWEAVEEAEAAFRAARARVHEENIGVAELNGDARLIRVGDALPGELAVWRFGRMLRSRRWQHWFGVAGGLLLGVPGWSGYYLRRRVLHRGGAGAGDAGAGAVDAGDVVIRGRHLHGAVFDLRPDAVVAADIIRRRLLRRPRRVHLEGGDARALLERALVAVNQSGGSRSDVDRAVKTLSLRADDVAPWPPGFSNTTLRLGERLRSGYWYARVATPGGGDASTVQRHQLLALEMGLQEEQERAALSGELAALRARWREAEEIAAIADSL
jgi:hypothetical protein